MTQTTSNTNVAPARTRLSTVELLAGFVLAALVFWQLTWNDHGWVAGLFADRRSDLYNAILSLSASLLGFVLATLAIVIGYAQSIKFAVIRASRWHLSLYGTFLQCVWSLTAALTLSLIGLFVDRDHEHVPVIGALTLGAVLVGLSRLCRATVVFHHVVTIVVSSGSRAPGE
ncbi:MAG: hypothetical protein JWP40_2389 [Blastococcus sp.]|nr:hypothetical protein [Blastococcus sp.]